jgi:SAM-dependent methyltransferase
MATWILVFIILAGSLFALKVIYVLCTALVLPITQGALYVSTARVRIDAFADAVPMQSGQLLVDLGCGDGRILRAAQKRYGVKAIGYEVNPLAYAIARLLCFGNRNIHIIRKNFWKADLGAADIVFCYLYPDVLKPLSQKLESELRPGAVVASSNFAIPRFQPVSVLRPARSMHNDPLYIYRF